VLRFHRKSKGFTLIELMIVVAIIGILAAIAIPRFANLIDRARQARTQGNLGSIRSSMSIYYGTTEGTWPSTLEVLIDTSVAAGPFLDQIPTVLLPASMGHTEANTSDAALDHTADWFYNGAAANGVVLVDCSHTEIGGADLVNTW